VKSSIVGEGIVPDIASAMLYPLFSYEVTQDRTSGDVNFLNYDRLLTLCLLQDRTGKN